MDLQTAFYVIGIVFMVVMSVLGIVTLVAVMAIKARINRICRIIEDKVAAVQNIIDKGGSLLRVVRRLFPWG